MSSTQLVFVLLTLIVESVISVQYSSEKSELVFAHILFRHGDRNIISTYPNDPWKDAAKYWPGGYGQLTNIGKQQQYELGQYLRKRYSSLITDNGSYNPDNIAVWSTDVDRTLMSAAFNLAGMFPPKNDQIWNDALLWQAVPIHTIPENQDGILTGRRACPLYEQSYKNYLQSTEIRSILESNSSLLQYLTEHMGKEVSTICDINKIYQTLLVEQLKNFTLPSWTHVFYPGSDMEKLANFYFTMATNTKQLARLKTGFLLREILERFTMKSRSTLSPNRTLWIYSAHDGTIANVLNALGLFETPHIPTYASCVFFELHKFNGTFYVEIFYKKNRGEDLKPLEPLFIPNCGERCPLEKFYEIHKEIIPVEDFETECRVSVASNDMEFTYKGFRPNILYFGIGLLFLVIAVAVFALMKRSMHSMNNKNSLANSETFQKTMYINEATLKY